MSITDYGFDWGPMRVERIAHISGRGYTVSVKAAAGEIQVYVSERGRKVEAYRPGVGRLVSEGRDRAS